MKLLRTIVNDYFSERTLPYWCILALDCSLVIFSGLLSGYLRFGGDGFAMNFWPILRGFCLCLIPFVLCFRIFHTYSGIVRYSTFVDLQRVTLANLTACVLCFLMNLAAGFADGDLAHSFNQYFLLPGIFDLIRLFIVATLLLILVRMVVKTLFDRMRKDETSKGAFIYGVKEGGVALAKSMQNQVSRPYLLKGFVSPDNDLSAKYLMNVKVYPQDGNLVHEMRHAGAKVLIVSPLQTYQFRKQEELINQLIEAGIKIMMMPEAEEWDGKSKLSHQSLHEVEIEDLLPREKIEVDMEAIGKMLKGKRILITGAAGSIGSEMARQVAKFQPAELILVDQAETPMHDVRLYMNREHHDLKVWTIVGSITNKEHMETLFSEHRPEYVFHAAAYKHVPMMEDNPAMAVQNNIYGTRVIADLAVKYGTKKFVMISTDKAVNPTNVMGCSKRICEIYCQSLNKAIEEGTFVPQTAQDGTAAKPQTQFITTRFGNVLGSNGSVIPIFKEQIKKGGPVMVTHPDIIRFFMLIPEACRLVLEAGTMGKGGEIFVFDMGEPVRIVDLAKRMIALSGASGVKIEFSGLREGEKLYEEVLNDAEQTKPTVHPKIKVASVREYPYELAARNEAELLELSRSFDDMAIVKKMKEIVPEYKSQNSKYQVFDKK